LNKRPTTIAIGSLTGSLLILLLTVMIIPAYASGPAEVHDADAFWVEPSHITFTGTNGTIGTQFNVTVALNYTDSVFSWQCYLNFNTTWLQCVTVGPTQLATSDYFAGHRTTGFSSSIQNTPGAVTGLGLVQAFESLLGTDVVNGTQVGGAKLMYVTFNITQMPGQGYNDLFNITSAQHGSWNTWVSPDGLTFANITTYDGNLTFIPEFSYILLLPALVVPTLMALIVRKRVSRKKVE
jgi:hypothetical protein